MVLRLLLGCALSAVAVAQTSSSQLELVNLREDVRGLAQRVGDLNLRVEQLERENSALRTKATTVDKSFITLSQFNDAVADMNRDLKVAIATSRSETLQQVGLQMEKLATQTNAAIDSLAKGQATRTPVQMAFTENYAKEGVSYTVQKGDTLAIIARKTGAKQQDIINANKIGDPSHITVGQTLFIPNASGK